MTIKRYIKEIIKKLIPQSILVYSLPWRIKNAEKERQKRKRLLKFEVHLADHCNLSCKGCDHFSPIAKENFLDIVVFKQDCERLSQLTGRRIKEMRLLGGEPLLHPSITLIMDIARAYFIVGEINIITNGILLTKQRDEFWKSCKKNRVGIIVSRYPIKLDYQTMENLAKKNGVELVYWGVKSEAMYRRPFDLKGTQDIAANYKICFKANDCIFLQEGKLFTCPTIPCAKHFNAYFNQNLSVSEDDYIDIYKTDNIGDILSFLCKPVPFCRYCDIGNMEYGVKWDISKKDISEWV